MNQENEQTTQINKKIKRYSVALGSCALILAVLALAANGSRNSSKIEEAPQTTAANEVEAELNGVPDTRQDITMIVPATEITTAMIEVVEPTQQTAAETANAVNTTEEEKAVSAPASYILPLGTDIGKDYSFGIPVYSSRMDDWRTHDGVDFNGAYGDGVKAIADGIVKDVYDDPLKGSVVVVDHGGGVVATYCGVTAQDAVMKGVLVSQGDKIGEISEIPAEADAEYPHLHLEITVDGTLADPLAVMGYDE